MKRFILASLVWILCAPAARAQAVLQASWITGTDTYQYGHNSIPKIPITGAPDTINWGRWAMVHDGSTFRLYLGKKGAPDTLYQFGFDPNTSRYQYGHNSIPELKITGIPDDADPSRIAMLHDGKDFRLYMLGKTNKQVVYQFAFNRQTNNYEYGYNSIPQIAIVGMPADANPARWAMLHDGRYFRLYFGKGEDPGQIYQAAFNVGSQKYEHGYESIPIMKIKDMPGAGKAKDFAMLHDGSDFRYYHRRRPKKN